MVFLNVSFFQLIQFIVGAISIQITIHVDIIFLVAF